MGSAASAAFAAPTRGLSSVRSLTETGRHWARLAWSGARALTTPQPRPAPRAPDAVRWALPAGEGWGGSSLAEPAGRRTVRRTRHSRHSGHQDSGRTGGGGSRVPQSYRRSTSHVDRVEGKGEVRAASGAARSVCTRFCVSPSRPRRLGATRPVQCDSSHPVGKHTSPAWVGAAGSRGPARHPGACAVTHRETISTKSHAISFSGLLKVLVSSGKGQGGHTTKSKWRGERRHNGVEADRGA